MSIRTALLAIVLGASASPAFAQGENEAVASESGPYGIVSQLNRMCLNVHGAGPCGSERHSSPRPASAAPTATGSTCGPCQTAA
jgi:hypothetical protein